MKIKNLLFLLFILLAFSCKKKLNTTVTPPQQNTYLTTSAGSTWNYRQVDSSGSTPAVSKDYTLISSSKDTLVNTRTYHVFNLSTGSNQYLALNGNDYYQYDSLPAGLGSTNFEQLYLKDNATIGTSWSQSSNLIVQGVPVPVTLTYKISEKGISRIVNSVTYNDVIHVSIVISSSLIPSASLTSSVDNYYATKYGLIENSTIIKLNYSGIVENVNNQTKIVSATLL